MLDLQFLTPDRVARKLQVTSFVRGYIERWGESPSYGEIAGGLGVSRSTARDIVRSAVCQGLLRRAPGAQRAISMPDPVARLTIPELDHIPAGEGMLDRHAVRFAPAQSTPSRSPEAVWREDNPEVTTPRRHEALAYIIGRIVGTGTGPSSNDIARALKVSRTRAQQLVDQLIADGALDRRPGSRNLYIRNPRDCRQIIVETCRGLGLTVTELAIDPEAPPIRSELPLLPPFEYLPEAD